MRASRRETEDETEMSPRESGPRAQVSFEKEKETSYLRLVTHKVNLFKLK